MTDGRSSARFVGTAVALALPVAGLLLLLAQPSADLHWEHHPSHFWLVLGTAAVSSVLAYATGAAAVRRGDARVLFVSLAFLSSAGFLALHALATPAVLLATPNPGFVVAPPFGLALASVLAAWSTADLSGDRAMASLRLGRQLRFVLLALMVLWAVLSLWELPPLSGDIARVERLLTNMLTNSFPRSWITNISGQHIRECRFTRVPW